MLVRVQLPQPDLKGYMPYKDREQQLEAQRQYYKEHKNEKRQRDRRTRKERAQWFRDILSKESCIKCGESDIACLDYHHRNPSEKEGGVGSMVNSFRPKKKILEEIAKCDVLCANCHRKHHWYETH